MPDESPAAVIDTIVAELGDWRGEQLSRIRDLMREAEPELVEEIKWRKPTNPLGVPVWTFDGTNVCTGETYKDKVKLTFAKGASLEDPDGLFNASLDANVRRVIDLHEADELDAAAFKRLVRAAVELTA